MPTLKQLRALGILAQTRSFTRTSEELAVTQSAVSVMIRELEEEIGTPLVERGKVIHLTPAGEALRQAGARAVADINRAVLSIQQGMELKSGLVKIAVGHLSAATFFPQALALFNSRFPHIAVEVIDGPVEQVSRLLIAEEVHVAIGSVDTHPGMAALLQTELLLADRVHAVFSKSADRKLSIPARTKWSALAHSPLILVGRVLGQWRELLLKLSDAGIDVNVAHEVKLYSTAVEMARCGLGVALLPGFAARRLDSRYFGFSLLERPSTHWDVYWMQRRSAAMSPAAEQLKAVVKEVLAKEAGGLS
jgi:DNA-binding transcriptional LysR family regulator